MEFPSSSCIPNAIGTVRALRPATICQEHMPLQTNESSLSHREASDDRSATQGEVPSA